MLGYFKTAESLINITTKFDESYLKKFSTIKLYELLDSYYNLRDEASYKNLRMLF